MSRRKLEPWGSKDRQKRHADLDQAMIEAWCKALDMTGFDELSPEEQAQDVANFLRLFRIPTETEAGEAWMEMTGSHQFQFDNLVMTFEDWMEGRRAEFRNPKSRRRGASQGWRAFFFERIVRVPGWKGTIIAQTDPDSQVHLRSLHELAAQLPAAALNRMGIRKVRSGARELAFRHGRWRTSSVIVKTASSRGLGRGGQLNGVLQTERPHWAPRSKADRSAFLGSCRMIAGNIVVDESTANQHDEFYDDTMATMRGENNAHLIFLPSHEHSINRLPFRSKKAREELERTLGEPKRFGQRNELDAFKRRLAWARKQEGWDEERAHLDALEFANWRRHKIADDCGNLRVFWREEPTTIEEAFSGSARTVLPLDIMESWREGAKELSRQGETGRLVELNPGGKWRLDFVREADAELTIYEMPEPGAHYCFGCDVASGYEVVASSGQEADYSVAIIKEVFSGRTVAKIRGHVFPKPFARMLLQAAVFYNLARGYVENNIETVVAHLIEDEDLECLGWVGSDILLTSERKVRVRGVGTQVQSVFGWRTTEKSKEYLASRHERFLVEWGEVEDGEDKGVPVDWQTLEEMLRIVRKSTTAERVSGRKTKTKIEAETGHDDCWIAEALAVLARDELLHSGEVEMRTSVDIAKTGEELLIEDFKRRAAARERKSSGERYDPVTGEVVKAGGMPGMAGF
mgnify:CR=1 FL=1